MVTQDKVMVSKEQIRNTTKVRFGWAVSTASKKSHSTTLYPFSHSVHIGLSIHIISMFEWSRNI